MPHFRWLAACVAMAIALGLAGSPALARCADGEAGCAGAAVQKAPMQLDDFMKTWKPVASGKRARKSRHARRAAPAAAKPAAAVAAAPTAAEAVPLPPSPPAAAFAAESPAPAETDGIAVVAFDEKNEIDAALDDVQIVAAGEINQLDRALVPKPVPTETVGQPVAGEPPPSDAAWVGKLLLAVAGTIALVGAARFVIA
jgi:hypothetical protein